MVAKPAGDEFQESLPVPSLVKTKQEVEARGLQWQRKPQEGDRTRFWTPSSSTRLGIVLVFYSTVVLNCVFNVFLLLCFLFSHNFCIDRGYCYQWWHRPSVSALQLRVGPGSTGFSGSVQQFTTIVKHVQIWGHGCELLQKPERSDKKQLPPSFAKNMVFSGYFGLTVTSSLNYNNCRWIAH